MEKIDWKYVTQEGGDRDNIIVPLAVDYICPHCDRPLHFKLGWTGTPQLTYVCNARCSGCKENPLFVYVVPPGEAKGRRSGELFIYPKSKRRRPYSAIDYLPDLSTHIREEYLSAVRIFNLQEWIPASVMCRRILEGLLHELLPTTEHKKTLHQQVLSIDQHRDLKKPIKDIADVLRIAGNRGAHFDPESRPTRESLELMLDLIDYLLEYFFVLPNKTTNLRLQVTKLSADN